MISMPKAVRRTHKVAGGRGPGGVRRLRCPYPIPADFAADYKAAFHLEHEVKNSWPAAFAQDDVDRAAAEWALDIKGQFAALRAARAGQLRTLDHRQVPRHSRPLVSAIHGTLRAKAAARERLCKRSMISAMSSILASGTDSQGDLDALLADPEVIAAVPPG